MRRNPVVINDVVFSVCDCRTFLFPPQFNKNTAVIMGGWRFITIKTSSVAYSIYSATLQPQELEFFVFWVTTPRTGNRPMQCRLLHIYVVRGSGSKFYKKTSCIYSGNSIIYALLVGVVAQLV